VRISLSQRRHQGSVFPDLPLAAEPVADPIACRCDSNATAAPVCADCSQPLLQAIARKTQHAGRTTLSVSSTHGEQQAARRAYLRIAPVLCQVARKSGAVGPAATLVSHPERGTAKISARPATDPARPPAAGLTPPATVANRDANCRRAWSQLPDLG